VASGRDEADDRPRLLADVLEDSESLSDDELKQQIGEAIGTHGWAAYHEARRRELIDEPESVTATVTDPDEGLAFEWSSGRGKAATGAGGAAWHDNSSKVVNADFGSLTENDREHIRETMSKISARFGEKSRLPLTQQDGIRIRADFAHILHEEWHAREDKAAIRHAHVDDEVGDWMAVGAGDYVEAMDYGGITGYARHPAEDREPPEPEYKEVAKGADIEVAAPFTWRDAVGQLLTKYMTAEATTVWLRMVDDMGEHLHGVPALMRWMPQKQRQYAAQLDAWVRELCGGDRPSGGTTEAEYSDPHIALITLTASARPDGDAYVGPVDHMVAMQESWPRTRDALRNAMVRAGFDTESWQYDRRAEPHTSRRGGGVNTAYTHEHVILITDGKVTREDLQPVLDTHVKYNRLAGSWAHGPDAVEVKRHDELTNAADYVADYASIETTDLRDRGLPYVMWAAAATACGYRTVSRSEATVAAVRADRCKQRYESDESLQRFRHGERLTWDGRNRRCCRECGSFHGIAQDGSVAAERLADTPEVAADGGVEVRTADDVVGDMRRIWRDTDAGGRVGHDPDTALFRYVVDEVVDTMDGPPPDPWAVIDAMRDLTPDDIHPHRDMDGWQVVDAGRRPPPDPAEVVNEYDPPLPAAWYAVRETRGTLIPDYWMPQTWHMEVIHGVISPGAYDGEAVGWDVSVDDGTDWRISHVTVFGEDRPAGAGGGVDTVTTINYADRFRGLWQDGALCRCAKCGMKGTGEWVINHLTRGRKDPNDDRHRIRHAEPLMWMIQPMDIPVKGSEWTRCAERYGATHRCECGGHTAVAQLWLLHASLSLWTEPHMWEDWRDA